jgi:hypothetical protein
MRLNSGCFGRHGVFGTDLSPAGLARKFPGHPVIANGKRDDAAWPRKVAAGLMPIAFTP